MSVIILQWYFGLCSQIPPKVSVLQIKLHRLILLHGDRKEFENKDADNV